MTAASSAALRGFFAWLERTAGATVPRSALDAVLGAAPPGPEILAALVTARVVREGPLATTLPCGEARVGCARDVLEADRGRLADPRLDRLAARRAEIRVAVCGRDPRECATVEVPPDALRQVRIAVDGLLRLVRATLGVSDAGSVAQASRASLGLDGPLVVGEQGHGDGVRDVILFVRPRPDAIAAFVDARARGARPALVLVPSPRTLAPQLRGRHGPGSHVEVDALSDVFAVKDGALVSAPRLRAVRADRARAPAPDRAPADVSRSERARPDVHAAGGAARSLPEASTWRQVRIRLVDGETVMVEIAGRYQRLTFVDLGLAGRTNRKPVKAWALLVACCEGDGTFVWKRFGTFANARQIVARLRKALRAALGIDEDPFEEFSHRTQWRARFRASVE